MSDLWDVLLRHWVTVSRRFERIFPRRRVPSKRLDHFHVEAASHGGRSAPSITPLS